MDEAQVSPATIARLSNAGRERSPSLDTSGSDDGGDDGQDGSSRKRKRLVNVTCEACKQRKVKCDKAFPSCSWCSRNQNVCEYKERKKPGLRAGYGRELERKLEMLEKIVQDQGRQLQAHLQAQCSSVSAPSPFAQTPQAGPGSAQGLIRHSPDHRQIKRPSDVGSSSWLQPNPLDEAQILPMSTQVPNELNTPQYQPLAESAGSANSPLAYLRQPSLIDPALQFPPYDLLYTLVDLYFKHVNSWLPLLNRKRTLDALFGPNSLTESDRILLHAIVVTSLRFSEDPRLTAETRKQYYEWSKQRVQLYGLENSNVKALQALVILAVDVTGTSNGPPGWNILALIARAVVQLGLSLESATANSGGTYSAISTIRAFVLPEPASWAEDEERRRLFWAAYLLDRYATVATAFEFALDEKEIERRLPCHDELFGESRPVQTRFFNSLERAPEITQQEDVHGSLSYHCELLGILSRIHLFLKRPFDITSPSDVRKWQESYRSLDSELGAWYFGLPPAFVNVTRIMKTNTGSKSGLCGWIMLHAAFHFTTIRLNSSAAYPTTTNMLFSPSYSAMQRCLTAVENLRQLGNYVVNSSILNSLGPPFAFTLWVAARLLLVHGSTVQHEINPDIAFFVATLAQMGQMWDVARRYSTILSRVLEEYRHSDGSNGAEGGHVTPSTVKLLADMRRCAYDLDVLISRQPQASTRSHRPTRVNSPAPNEISYLDVFDLFNFPKLPLLAGGVEMEGVPDAHSLDVGTLDADQTLDFMSFAPPNPNADWLYTGGG